MVYRKGIDQAVKYYSNLNLKYNLKTKILVFKKRGELKKNERWFMHYQILEVADEINYLRVTLEVQED
jgi:hypothetical protein